MILWRTINLFFWSFYLLTFNWDKNVPFSSPGPKAHSKLIVNPFPCVCQLLSVYNLKDTLRGQSRIFVWSLFGKRELNFLFCNILVTCMTKIPPYPYLIKTLQKLSPEPVDQFSWILMSRSVTQAHHRLLKR